MPKEPRQHLTVKTWTAEQDAKLTELLEKGATATRAAAALNRTVSAVQARARSLGMPFKSRRTAFGTWVGPFEYK